MRILCFGDSNTYGYDPRSWFGETYPTPWVDVLAEKLGCPIINAGENGREILRSEHSLNLLLRRHQPLDLLIIMLGTNDLLQGNSPEAVAARMAQLLGKVEFEKLKILLLAPPPMKLGEWVPSRILVDASRQLRELYQDLGVRCTGGWEISLTFDGVHFTAEGHTVFAEHLYRYLKNGG